MERRAKSSTGPTQNRPPLDAPMTVPLQQLHFSYTSSGLHQPTSTELQMCPDVSLMGSRLAGGSTGTEEGRPWSYSLLMSDLVNTWKFTSLEKHLKNTHPLGNVTMSRAREVVVLVFKGFLQQSCQVTSLFKSILQSEQAFSPTFFLETSYN